MKKFTAIIEIIGANPFVFLPDRVLSAVLRQAGKDRGPIRVRGTVNGDPYRQTLLKYKGEWRLYINGFMLKNSPRRVGEKIVVEIEFDPEDRAVPMPPKLEQALRADKSAAAAFRELTPSRRFEIIRYIAALKTEQSVDKNVERAILHLKGKAGFAGRWPWK
ncbi:MAG TPA: YdeI/OmpD-associated family protein [Puia sp.]|nr:YdeI/OmpD-associated family protein [Puia sp.]